ncbi:B-box zinc finger protein [bacterium]|nr:B-box zinc finger protein [bacterium]
MADTRPGQSVERSKVVLVGFQSGKDRYAAIKKLSEILGMDFEEASEIADTAPVDLVPSLPTEAAEALSEKLVDAGAAIEVLPLTKNAKFCEIHPHRFARASCKVCGKYVCIICLHGSKGKLFCPEHYELWKQKRVLRAVGGAFLVLLLVFLGILFRHPITRMARYLGPHHVQKVGVIFVTQRPGEAKGAYYMRVFKDTTAQDYLPGEEHTVADIGNWYNTEYRRIAGKKPEDGGVMDLHLTGTFDIDLPPPMPHARDEMSYKAFAQYSEFRGWFQSLMNEHLLDAFKTDDIVVAVELVDETGFEKDFMEELGFAAGGYAYVRVPVVNLKWSAEYYVAAVAHYIGRSMGATLKLSDKGYPLDPHGLAEPAQTPKYPQQKASLMSCYRPIQPFEIERPSSLDEYVISPLTAWELGWIGKRRISALYPDVN